MYSSLRHDSRIWVLQVVVLEGGQNVVALDILIQRVHNHVQGLHV